MEVPQGSFIGPQAFTYYTRRVDHIIHKHGLKYHIYADDVQIYTIFDPNCSGDAGCALFHLSCCVKDLQTWMLNNRLKLNQAKNEFLLLYPPTITVPYNILLLILMAMRFPFRLPFATWVLFLTTPWP